MSAYTRLVSTPEFRWLRDGWQAELGTREDWRLWDDKFIRWVKEWDVETDQPRRDPGGHYVWYPEEWVDPVHEGVKRQKRRGRAPIEWYWLREVLMWNGHACVCGHRSVVECVAARSRTTAEVVTVRLRAMARSAARTVGHAHDVSSDLASDPDSANVRRGAATRPRIGPGADRKKAFRRSGTPLLRRQPRSS